ncbi:7618_t:CDS:2, partial [Acaulospora morrowiae]
MSKSNLAIFLIIALIITILNASPVPHDLSLRKRQDLGTVEIEIAAISSTAQIQNPAPTNVPNGGRTSDKGSSPTPTAQQPPVTSSKDSPDSTNSPSDNQPSDNQPSDNPDNSNNQPTSSNHQSSKKAATKNQPADNAATNDNQPTDSSPDNSPTPTTTNNPKAKSITSVIPGSTKRITTTDANGHQTVLETVVPPSTVVVVAVTGQSNSTSSDDDNGASSNG